MPTIQPVVAILDAASSARRTPPSSASSAPVNAVRARQAKGESIPAIARHLKIGRSTLYRALQTSRGDGPISA